MATPEDDVRDWLKAINLDRYLDNFINAGYDDVSMLGDLDEADLDAMDIKLPGHRKRFLLNFAKANTDSSTPATPAAVAVPVVAAVTPPNKPSTAPTRPSKPPIVAKAKPAPPTAKPKPARKPQPPTPAAVSATAPADVVVVPEDPVSSEDETPLYENEDEEAELPAETEPQPQATPPSDHDTTTPEQPRAAGPAPPPANTKPTKAPEPTASQTPLDVAPERPPKRHSEALQPPTAVPESESPVEPSSAPVEAAPLRRPPPTLPTRPADEPPALPTTPRPSSKVVTADIPPALPTTERPVSKVIPGPTAPTAPVVPAATAEEGDVPTGLDDSDMTVFVTFEKNSLFHKHHIVEFTTAGELLSEFLKETNLKRQSQASPSEWTLWEVFDCPPIERKLAYHERVSTVKGQWPATDNCRFVVRELTGAEQGDASREKMAKLDKRGGARKTWKSRHCVLRDTCILYYTKQPKNQKEAGNPQGSYVFVNSNIYNIRKYKKAPRSKLAFCIKPQTTPMWDGVCDKEVLDFYDNNCKFMCAQSEADRADWVASIIQAQQDLVDRGEIYGAAGGPPVPESFEHDAVQDDDPAAEAAPVTVEDVEVSAVAAEAVEDAPVQPEDFVPIQPRPVRGVGLGNVMKSIKKPLSE